MAFQLSENAFTLKATIIVASTKRINRNNSDPDFEFTNILWGLKSRALIGQTRFQTKPDLSSAQVVFTDRSSTNVLIFTFRINILLGNPIQVAANPI